MTAVADWQESMKRAIRDPEELCRLLQLAPDWLGPARAAARQFPLFVTLEYLSRIRAGDPHDPLLRQVLPLEQELDTPSGFVTDPVDERTALREAGVLQKYHGRVLLVTTGACAIHCRYCFRRHFPYSDSPRAARDWQPALDRLAADPDLDEVLWSGGDPLTLADAQLEDLAQRLERIPQLRRLRIHTRLPIVIPQRVNAELLGWMQRSRLAIFVVVHANHPAEIDSAVQASLERLGRGGVPVLNQTVLLRGINDDPDTLAQLSLRLLDAHVLPYYLHQLDPVAGAAHFAVPVERGRELIAQLRARLPGYAVPRYVQEVPGDESKRVLA
ncbi:MAG: EF-P beta-lysylation protein EpmB [Pirellulales bacterium]